MCASQIQGSCLGCHESGWGSVKQHVDDQNQPDSYELLSPREKEVLRLVALGYTSRQIAEQLYLSVKTVGTYRARLMVKLNLKNRPALVRYALKRGLLANVHGSTDMETQ